VSTVLVCLGLVAGADRLKPISWNVWAGNIEREGGGANPYKGLEERAGFLDIRVYRANCWFFLSYNADVYRRSVRSLQTGSGRVAMSPKAEKYHLVSGHRVPCAH
jgi:hypothetical protein